MTNTIRRVLSGETLDAAAAEAAFDRFMSGEATQAEMAALLAALRMRGETPAEVAGGVRALRKAMIPLALHDDRIIDTCGTGGGTLTTFNISTAAAIVAAGGGVRIAKHGNRSFTSKCGSADVLEILGVPIELPPADEKRMFEETGFVFMFAPAHHPAMRHVAPVRAALGVTTIMNLLGPLANPAGVRRQVVGVAHPDLQRLVADTLLELGHERALVVHGEPGMDELSPLGPTRVFRIENGTLSEFEVAPSDFGWPEYAPSDLAGGRTGGERGTGPPRHRRPRGRGGPRRRRAQRRRRLLGRRRRGHPRRRRRRRGAIHRFRRRRGATPIPAIVSTDKLALAGREPPPRRLLWEVGGRRDGNSRGVESGPPSTAERFFVQGVSSAG